MERGTKRRLDMFLSRLRNPDTRTPVFPPEHRVTRQCLRGHHPHDRLGTTGQARLALYLLPVSPAARQPGTATAAVTCAITTVLISVAHSRAPVCRPWIPLTIAGLGLSVRKSSLTPNAAVTRTSGLCSPQQVWSKQPVQHCSTEIPLGGMDSVPKQHLWQHSSHSICTSSLTSFTGALGISIESTLGLPTGPLRII